MTSSWPERLIEAGTLFLSSSRRSPSARSSRGPKPSPSWSYWPMAATYVLSMLRHWGGPVGASAGLASGATLSPLVFFRTVPFLGAARSLDPHATWREGIKLLTVGVFLLVCYNTYRTAAQARRALWTIGSSWDPDLHLRYRSARHVERPGSTGSGRSPRRIPPPSAPTSTRALRRLMVTIVPVASPSASPPRGARTGAAGPALGRPPHGMEHRARAPA